MIVAYVKNLGEEEYVYESFIMNGDGERYDIVCSLWGRLLNIQVLQKSIELYGEAEVAAEIFWNMTFFGLTEQQHNNECKILDERLKEAESTPKENYIDAEDVFKKLLGDNYVPPEKNEQEEAARKEKMQADWAECEKLYKMLNECVIAEIKNQKIEKE